MQKSTWLAAGCLALLFTFVIFSGMSQNSANIKNYIPRVYGSNQLASTTQEWSLSFRYHAPQPFNVSPNLLKSMELPPKTFADLSMNVLRQFVPVTGASSDHFNESIDSVASMQTNMPGKTIIYYDLGLTTTEIAQLKTWCNVEYRKFNMTAYPTFVKNLVLYAWKPLIIQEVLRQYPAVFWMDASFRWMTPNMTQLYQRAIDSDGFVLFGRTIHSNYAVTHPGMYAYLPTNVEMQKSVTQLGATGAFVVNTRSNFDEVLWWYYMCALTQDCIASMTNRFCNFPNDHYKTFAKCHRFDQSLANILLSNRWRYNTTRYCMPDSNLFKFEYLVTSNYKIKVCNKP
ncbi:hypothetical protein LSAT2_010574 [Lamellibrachia satsuma]|nr:hypothetical protein LSAT2_010574 [Lamellibrachia satsuma]